MDLMQECLDLSKAALALFDFIEADGIDAPLDNANGVLKVKAVVDASNNIREYYYKRNIARMLALGISPAALLRMAEESYQLKIRSNNDD